MPDLWGYHRGVKVADSHGFDPFSPGISQVGDWLGGLTG